MRIRILPILALAALMAFTLRVGGLWWGGGPQPAFAQEAPAEAGDEEAMAEESAAEEEVATGEGGAAEPTEEMVDEGVTDESDSATPAYQRAGLSADPFELTDEEIEILQSLAERRALLERREREVEQREAMLAAAEARIEEKIQRLETLRADIEKRMDDNELRDDAQIASLARIYSAMKPKDAAKIFESLEDEVLLDVMRAMKERTSAAILSKMNPARAQEITQQLAMLNSLEDSTN